MYTVVIQYKTVAQLLIRKRGSTLARSRPTHEEAQELATELMALCFRMKMTSHVLIEALTSCRKHRTCSMSDRGLKLTLNCRHFTVNINIAKTGVTNAPTYNTISLKYRGILDSCISAHMYYIKWFLGALNAYICSGVFRNLKGISISLPSPLWLLPFPVPFPPLLLQVGLLKCS